MNVNIRNYQPTDALAIEKLATDFQNFLIPIDPLKRIILTPDYGKKNLKLNLKEISNKQGVFYVAEVGFEIVGYIVGIIVTQSHDELIGHVKGKLARVLELYVKFEYRKLGVGRQLMQSVENFYRGRRCDLMFVEVFVPNKNAHRFYQAMGHHDRNTDLVKKLYNNIDMGYFTELNTLLGLPKDFDVSTLVVGKRYTVIKEKERVFPLHIAMLLIDSSWNFYGYCVAHSAKTYEHKTQLEFEVLTLFSSDEQKLYKQKFLEAAKKTGEA